jgi:hypothetical protein
VEHVWVEVKLPYGPYSDECYRGYIASREACGNAPEQWIPLDPAFVPYKPKKPYPTADVEFDLNSTIIELTRNAITTVDYFTGLNYTAVEERIEEFLNHTRQEYIADVVERGLPGEPIFPEEEKLPEIIPGTLPFSIAAHEKYRDIPLEFRVLVRISLNKYGRSVLNATFDLTKISTRQLLLIFEPATKDDAEIIQSFGSIIDTPAYMAELRPQLWLGDRIITLSPESFTPGETLELVYEIHAAGSVEKISRTLYAGGTHALVSAPGNVPSQLLQKYVNNSWDTYTSLAQNTTIRDALGDVLYLMGANYFASVDMFAEAAGRQNGVRLWRPSPGFAVVSYYPYVGYTGSIPSTIREGQPQIDVQRNVFSIKSYNPRITKKSFMAYLAALSSEMEGAMFHAFGSEGVTAAGIIRDANEKGIPIYVISSSNIDRVLPELQVAENVKERIRNVVNQGFRVMIPQRELTYGNWSGSGWVEFDPETNAAGYMITDDLGAIIHGSRPKKDILVGSISDTRRHWEVKDEDGDGRDDSTGMEITDIYDPEEAEEAGLVNPSGEGVLNPKTALKAGIEFEAGILGNLDEISYRLSSDAAKIRRERMAPAGFRLLLDPTDEAAKAEWGDAYKLVKNLEDEAAWASRNIKRGAMLARGLAVVGAAVETADTYAKVKELHEEGRYSEAGAEILAGGGRLAGGIAGATAGAKIGLLGCAAGPAGCAIGVGVGTVIGGIVGAWFGEKAVEKFARPLAEKIAG